MGAHPEASTRPLHGHSGVYIASVITMVAGYCFFVIGVVSPAWRLETGFTYGLWVRCYEDACKYIFTGFKNFLVVVQIGIFISLLLLTTSMCCLLLERLMKLSQAGMKQAICTEKVFIVTSTLGEIFAAFSVGIYGSKTVMAREKFPVLAYGFAITGIGIIVCLMGTILRLMGPTDSWNQGLCCLAPRSRYRTNMSVFLRVPESDSPSAGIYPKQSCKGKRESRSVGSEKVQLMSCCHKSKKSYGYSSVPSTINSSSERGYVHYEEISFDEMPPPPLEILNQYQTVNPSLSFFQEAPPGRSTSGRSTPPGRSTNGRSSHEYILSLNDTQNRAPPSLRHLEPKPLQQIYTQGQSSVSYHSPELQRRQLVAIPQATPRQISQQRSVVQSAQRHITTNPNRDISSQLMESSSNSHRSRYGCSSN